jgi:DNA-binding XRE family transcriptional regulator
MLFNIKNSPPGFYVYAYLRDNGSPYYIGKGSGNRAWKKSKKHNVKVPSNLKYITILENNLTEIGALALERRYIRWYGRKNNGTGILINLTNGGEGVSGIVCSQTSIDKYKKLFSKKIVVFGVEYNSQSEAAKTLNVSRKTIVRWSKEGASTYSKEKTTTIKGLTFESRTAAAKHFNVHIETIRNWIKNEISYFRAPAYSNK